MNTGRSRGQRLPLPLQLACRLSAQVNQNRIQRWKATNALLSKQLVYQITWKYFLNAPQTFNALIWHMSGSRDSLAGTLGSSALTIYQGMAVDGAEMDTMDRMDLVDPKRWPKGSPQSICGMSLASVDAGDLEILHDSAWMWLQWWNKGILRPLYMSKLQYIQVFLNRVAFKRNSCSWIKIFYII